MAPAELRTYPRCSLGTDCRHSTPGADDEQCPPAEYQQPRESDRVVTKINDVGPCGDVDRPKYEVSGEETPLAAIDSDPPAAGPGGRHQQPARLGEGKPSSQHHRAG